MEEFTLQYLICSVIFVSLTFGFYLLSKQRSSVRDHRLPPGPKPLPILGNLLKLGQNPHRSLAHLARIYGPIMFLRLGSVKTIVISSPALAKQVLQFNEQTLSSRRVPDALKDVSYHKVSLIWNPVNQTWQYLRTLLKSHLFNASSLGATQSVRRRKIQELTQFIRDEQGKPISIAQVAFCTMLNLFSTTIFSMDMVDFKSDSSQEFKDLVCALMLEFGKSNLTDLFPFLAPLDLQGRRQRFTLQFAKLANLLDQMIENRLRESAYKDKDRDKDRGRSDIDLLDVFLQLNREDDSKLSRQTIIALLVDLLIAGSETTSTTVEWAMAELFQRPELMAMAREEIVAVIGFEREVEESDISQLPFLEAVFKETLRLHPPLPLMLPRIAKVDIDINGFTMLENSEVLVNLWAIGRDENVWESPTKFMPERFMCGEKGEIDFKDQYFEFIPFGSGRRMCPGMPLGVRMVQLMLASLIQSFYWRLETNDLDMTEKLGLTLTMASPLKAIATPSTI